MSLFDYQCSMNLKYEGSSVPFYALIMAAMRKADSANLERLQKAFPWVWEELKNRYNAPGGVLQEDGEIQFTEGAAQ